MSYVFQLHGENREVLFEQKGSGDQLGLAPSLRLAPEFLKKAGSSLANALLLRSHVRFGVISGHSRLFNRYVCALQKRFWNCSRQVDRSYFLAASEYGKTMFPVLNLSGHKIT